MVDAKDVSGDGDNITITVGDKHIVATDERTGIASQGKTKPEALANLAEALELYEQPVADEDDASESADAPWF
ncbi:type II toxin-antitoxin system HicB family antitoxin [Haloarchaeobius sp. DT45]|uniref:type II toxin-antitoxin system HicB family antitoxin n=1 Tax=Haloarchaeobius sp. DT45 TaxID=3446116 RepID=UPI003F6CEC9E